MPQFLVSVIVVNWNGKAYLGDCLTSLCNQTFLDFELIVVDNGSKDGSVEYVESRFPGFVRLLRNSDNKGFAQGNNQGIRVARGEYIALLNNDAQANRRWLEELVKAAEEDRRAGMLASKIYLQGGHKIIDNVGHLALFAKQGFFCCFFQQLAFQDRSTDLPEVTGGYYPLWPREIVDPRGDTERYEGRGFCHFGFKVPSFLFLVV